MRHDRFYNFNEKQFIKKKRRKLRTVQSMIFDDFLDLWFPFGTLWLPSGSFLAPLSLNFLKHLFLFILVSPLADVRNYFCKKANIRTPSLKIVFVCFWNFQKTFNRLRNFAVGIWRHAYAHGISSDWKYHVAFHDRHMRIVVDVFASFPVWSCSQCNN